MYRGNVIPFVLPREDVLIVSSRTSEARLLSILLSVLDVKHEIAATGSTLEAQCSGNRWAAVMLDLDDAKIDALSLIESGDRRLCDQPLIGVADNHNRYTEGLDLGNRRACVLHRPFKLMELSDALVMLDIPTRPVHRAAIEAWVRSCGVG